MERAWKTGKEKGHNLYLKKHISRDIKEIRRNDVINDDVIEKWKMVKIKNFFGPFDRKPSREQKILLRKSLKIILKEAIINNWYF